MALDNRYKNGWDIHPLRKYFKNINGEILLPMKEDLEGSDSENERFGYDLSFGSGIKIANRVKNSFKNNLVRQLNLEHIPIYQDEIDKKSQEKIHD
jgi:hypothetical protein